jgi:hypothetical protein
MKKKNCNDKKVKLLVVATLRCVAGKKNHDDEKLSFSSSWPWVCSNEKKKTTTTRSRAFRHCGLGLCRSGKKKTLLIRSFNVATLRCAALEKKPQ